MREADTLDGADVSDTTPEPDDEDILHDGRLHQDRSLTRRRMPEVRRVQSRGNGRSIGPRACLASR